MAKSISVVVPCYNEGENVRKTVKGIYDVLVSKSLDFEIIAVNDGSKDGTWDEIKKLAIEYPQLKGINFTGNFGQSAAYQAGFDRAIGDYILICSADLETPFDYLLKVIEFLDQGYDFVNTNRSDRWGAEKASRKAKSGLANKILTKISGVKIKDRGSGMKGFTRTVAKNLRLYGDMHRFIPDYLSVYKIRMVEIDVPFKDREYGVSAYKGHKRTIKVLLDIITLSFMLSFAYKPFRAMPGRLFGFTGAVLGGFGGLGTLYLLILKIMGESIGNRPLFTVSVMLVVIGVQMVMIGMIGELLMRTYFESSDRKTYLVRETLG